jgi:hypothetical protein
MERIFRHPPVPGFAVPEAATLPAVSRHAIPVHTYQSGLVGSREAYYAYCLGREVQQYHQRLFETQHLHAARQ